MATTTTTTALGKATLNVIAAYQSWSIDNIMSIRTPDCISEVQPASLNSPPMDNETYRVFFDDTVIPRLSNWKFTISDIIEDDKAKKVVLFATAKADAVATGGVYEQQYVLTFWFDGEGKVKRMIEWLDSAKLVAQREIFGDAVQN